MIPLSIAKISFELWLIFACLFAPADYESFEIEIREGNRTEITFYVNRSENSFTIFSDKEFKNEMFKITNENNILSVKAGRKTTTFDNTKHKIATFKESKTVTMNIDKHEMIFIMSKELIGVQEKGDNKVFVIKKSI